MFTKATKRNAKLRLALSGVSGAGKTWTALTIASHLVPDARIAVVDTEHGSAAKYADVFAFDTLELDQFHPDRFVEAIQAASQAGYDVIILDSLTHAWSGTGGLLDLVDQIARRKYQSNSFAAWKDATPIQNRLVESIIRAPIHVIATMRSKTEYVTERDERTGKAQPRKVGTAPQQRDNLEYEFDITGELDIDNTLVIQKTRCPALVGGVYPKPGRVLAETMAAWLGSGAADPPPASADAPAAADVASDKQRAYIDHVCDQLGWSTEHLAAFAAERRMQLLTLTKQQAGELITDLKLVLSPPAAVQHEPAASVAPAECSGDAGALATERQIRALERLVLQRGIHVEDELAGRFGGRGLRDLSMDEAGRLLGEWQQRPRR